MRRKIKNENRKRANPITVSSVDFKIPAYVNIIAEEDRMRVRSDGTNILLAILLYSSNFINQTKLDSRRELCRLLTHTKESISYH